MPQNHHSICTHTSMTRVFDSSERQICDACKKPSRLGWVYICTEDHNGFLPNHQATEFFTEYKPSFMKRLEPYNDPPKLNTWVVKAIEEGRYSPEQVEILKAQKINLLQTLASIEGYQSESEDDGPVTQLLEDLKETPPSDNNSITEPATPEKKGEPSIAMPACRYRCCPSCRTSTRERSWLSLNKICNEEYSALAPPEWEFQNRRLSELSIVQNLGLRGRDPPTYVSTPEKKASPEPQKPSPAESEKQRYSPSKTPRRNSYGSTKRPSTGARIPLKRTARGSFTRGNGGLLYFSHGGSTPDVSEASEVLTLSLADKDTPPPVETVPEEHNPDSMDADDPDPDGGVPLTTEKQGSGAGTMENSDE
ncbi:hypothetical protein FQN54_007913 [Arachnomyces sp. PD_36]|nr:hypothetical protein FQN54_007913 [Arachnomyces sp. PD_36]